MKPLSPETLAFIRAHRSDDMRTLALQAPKYPKVDMPEALIQIAGRQIAEKKNPFVGRAGRHPLSATFVHGTMLFRSDGTL